MGDWCSFIAELIIGQSPLYRLLSSIDADANMANDYDETPYYMASEMGHVEVVRILIERGADIEMSPSFPGSTPLCAASEEGHIEVVNLLLNKGASVEGERLG